MPSGVANSEDELFAQPKSLLSSKYANMVTYDILEGVGHFAAYQAPEKLFKSILGFVEKVESIHLRDGDRAENKAEL